MKSFFYSADRQTDRQTERQTHPHRVTDATNPAVHASVTSGVSDEYRQLSMPMTDEPWAR